ncbi:four-carbon acid sugar kinase family protein [Rhizobium sp. 42MFCr.1]|jgi:uncharacterized protein YgbK (DUF1537 family)|uniref:four-carbon acid sugar kinase family protein n=1 Tax=Rhizobium sp. 42MFCr.1 TaxID=1048680 RepID=UPI00036F7D45|nr:four-carbon acid sugar kinase family protein [Rhizobium sp. 42MFCr.1]
MTLKVAIIADDLTGALDTGTPFVDAGLSVAVAIDVSAISETLATGCEVVVVNTASRALPEEEAAGRVSAAAKALLAASPQIVLKKIDSRLKGNVAAESVALAAVFGHETIVVAPAIPDQDRLTHNGHVVGRGVDKPLPIAELFDASGGTEVLVRDAETDSDLDQVVEARDWKRALAVGARGIGAALARKIGQSNRTSNAFAASSRTVFAFGSRDPITTAQMARLEGTGCLAAAIDASMGAVPSDAQVGLPLLVRCTGEISGEAVAVADRFAKGVKSIIEMTRPDMLMVGGGDTALAVFRELGIRVLRPQGEIEAGIPWFDVVTADGLRLRCAVKSGGFGNSDSLVRLIAQNQAA